MTRSLDLRVGIDVGGTNTDAVVLDRSDKVLTKFKTPTTTDLTTGISKALAAVLSESGVSKERVTHVMLGTTHATNAVLSRSGLLKVGVVRIGAPATMAIPPLTDWPAELRRTVSAGEVIIGGGHELTGERLAPFDRDGLVRFLEEHGDEIESVAITSVYSPVVADDEQDAKEIVEEVLGGIPVSMSHGIGALGLLERESACVLNASLIGVAATIVEGLTGSLEASGIDALAYIAQNDGTLMAAEYVLAHPVLTIGSGPTNSMRGAAYLTGASDLLVVDVGGTSTDIGLLVNGFPRASTSPVDIGGVRTNFRMPDLVSIAVGGGTIVRPGDGGAVIGPDSVGYRITDEALVFAGSTPTLTDAAVCAGRADIGEPRDLASQRELLLAGMKKADALIAEAADRIKTSRGDVEMVAVGGGSVIIAEKVPGISVIHRPDNFEVANAIGAAIAMASGDIDRVYKLAGRTREEVVEDATSTAVDEAIAAGADPDQIEIVELEEVPMAYLTEPVIRIRAKAAGPLGDI